MPVDPNSGEAMAFDVLVNAYLAALAESAGRPAALASQLHA